MIEKYVPVEAQCRLRESMSRSAVATLFRRAGCGWWSEVKMRSMAGQGLLLTGAAAGSWHRAIT